MVKRDRLRSVGGRRHRRRDPAVAPRDRARSRGRPSVRSRDTDTRRRPAPSGDRETTTLVGPRRSGSGRDRAPGAAGRVRLSGSAPSVYDHETYVIEGTRSAMREALARHLEDSAGLTIGRESFDGFTTCCSRSTRAPTRSSVYVFMIDYESRMRSIQQVATKRHTATVGRPMPCSTAISRSTASAGKLDVN